MGTERCIKGVSDVARIIKFRAWDKQQGTMHVIFDSEKQTEWYLPKLRERFEIMQFTGLIDQNGTEIFDGDILVVRHLQSRHEEYWEQPNGPAIPTCVRWDVDAARWTMPRDTMNFEVIGNVFEHPHLLQTTSMEAQP